VNARQLAALTDPLAGADPAELARHRYHGEAGDGALITTVLAVDR
jgi:hypothetical protein